MLIHGIEWCKPPALTEASVHVHLKYVEVNGGTMYVIRCQSGKMVQEC